MDPIKNFLSGTIPKDKYEARKIQRQVVHYIVQDGKHYTLLRCLGPDEASYVVREVHKGVCENHTRARSMAVKIIRQGYYWPTIHRDTNEFSKRCDKC